MFGMHLQKGLVYLYTKKFLPLPLHFWNYNLSPNGQMISQIGAQACSQARLLGAGTKYWRLIIVECLQPNKFKERPNFDPIYQISCFSSLGDASCFHVFPEKDRLSLSGQGKKIMFLGKNTIFPDNTGKIMCRCRPFWKVHLFRRFEENIISPCIFYERPSFIFRLTCKIMFLGKINIIFPNNTKKIIFQR